MNPHTQLRLTPSNSPFFKSPSPRSPTKGSKSEEAGLRLQKVIGTTAASANGFDCVPATRQFAYTAGAAAVVASVDDDLKVTQRFFRARPTLGGTSRDAGQWLLSPNTPNESRTRTFGLAKDSGANGSPVGTSGRDWLDSPTSKSSAAKDRVKAATSVALSPNGKWIAIGETGYRPRVLLFSNSDESSELPVVALAEHTFGVRSLAFSPDSKYLASLGTVNDGFLFIWSIDERTGAATLHSCNKCTAMVNVMTWMGCNLVMAGLRFVKVWRPDEESTGTMLSPIRTADFTKNTGYQKQKVLAGKNCLLGDLLDANFTTVTPLSASKAIVCAETGEICLLDDTAGSQFLRAVERVDFNITAAMVDWNRALRVAGAAGCVRVFEASSLKGNIAPDVKRRQSSMPTKATSEPTVATAMAAIGGITVELDSHRGIRLTRSDANNAAAIASHQLPAHHDTVMGIKPYAWEKLPQASFLTFSTNGSIRVWDGDGCSCAHVTVPVDTSPEMYDISNELRAAAAISKGAFIAAGDRYGTLSILNVATKAVATQVRAHSAEIVDLVAFERSGAQLIVSASRDRMIQLFHWTGDRLDLLQTMDEHAGAVNGLLAAPAGDMLLSWSSDRTIVVREAMLRTDDDPASVAYIVLRTISLKSSPSSVCFEASDEDVLVSTVDRNIGRYNIRTGQAGFSFKCSDLDGGEATSIGRVIYSPSMNGNPTIVGISSSDKSVRLYSEYGSLVARDWGHTEGITDVMLLPPKDIEARDVNARSFHKLITVAADSTIFIWDTTSAAPVTAGQTQEANGVSEMTPVIKTLTPMAPPLRKVLSYSELNRYRSREKSVEGNSDSSSPSTVQTPMQPPPSPPRLKKKSSRASLAQAPKLEPPFRSSFVDSSGRRNLRKRSPSPPSPRQNPKTLSRRSSLGFGLRSKSSEALLSQFNSSSTPPVPPLPTSTFGSLTSSTESVCRTLRAYRKKLSAAATVSNSSSQQQQQQTLDGLNPDALRELEKELKLTARLVGEKSQGKALLNEAVMTKLLDQASERIVGMLDERIKERVEGDLGRKSGYTGPGLASGTLPGAGKAADLVSVRNVDDFIGRDERVEVLAGALAEVRLRS